MKIAILSDIHGNSYALSKVLEDIRARNADAIINLGDSLYGPLNPSGTWEMLNACHAINISGNEDRIILENLTKDSGNKTLEYVKSQIDSRMTDWLRSLPFDMIFNDLVYGCHASPLSDTEYLLEKVSENHIDIRSQMELDELLKEKTQKIIVCGHSHVPNIVQTDCKLIINPGSVGLPAYDDDLPVYHRMQNYSPRANYSILNVNGESVSVERVALEYDFESAARLAERNGRNDWAHWIRTGIV
ncbi:MAG: metallophosphoesterase family protein [Bacteroidales bacterium]|nr:metallophosphoesterase family protein [Bacteroidales bacterium]